MIWPAVSEVAVLRDFQSIREHFQANGWAIVRGVLSADELRDLRDETAALVASDRDAQPSEDYFWQQTPSGTRVLHRVNLVQAKRQRNDSALLLLGHPIILEAARAILESEPLPYALDMIFKGEHGAPEIRPHRDVRDLTATGFQRGIVSCDVYLDDATTENGCLRVLPKSHTVPDVSALCAQGWALEGLEDVPMRAGDVLFHDGMIVHASSATVDGAPIRRVLYPVFQSLHKVTTDGLYEHAPVPTWWVAQWLKLLAHAVERRQVARPLEPPFRPAWPDGWQREAQRAELTLRPHLASPPMAGVVNA